MDGWTDGWTDGWMDGWNLHNPEFHRTKPDKPVARRDIALQNSTRTLLIPCQQLEQDPTYSTQQMTLINRNKAISPSQNHQKTLIEA